METNIKCVLITGAAGLIGSNLSHYILDNKNVATVIGTDNLSGGWKENLPLDSERFKFVLVDTESDNFLKVFDQYRPDIVYHCSAYAAEALSPFIRKYNYQNNLIATANVINGCIKYNVCRLIFYSSMAVYGHGALPFHEAQQPNPIDPYGVSKYACELDIQIAGQQHDLDWCILRPHNVYGKRQIINDPYRNVIGIFMYKALVGDPITIYGDGKQKRAFSYIDDSLEPMWKAGIDERASKQIINLGGTKEYTINELARVVKNQCSTPVGIIRLPPRHEVREAYSTYDKSIAFLDFKHRIDLEEGVKQMWDWAISQPHRERKVWESYEIDDGLYKFWQKDALKDGFWKKENNKND